MTVFFHFSERETTTINDAGVIIFINNSHIVAAQKGGDGPQIGLITRGEDEGSFLSEETS